MSEPVGDTDVAELLADWLPRQRWFAAGPAEVVLTSAGAIDLALADGDVAVVHMVSARSSPETAATYQVPLTYRSTEVPELAHALVGSLTTAAGVRFVYDAAHDPAFVTEWIRLVSDGLDQLSAPEGPRARVRGVLRPGEESPDADRSAKVLSGEQSNTSIIVGAGGPDPIMIKIIRVLQPGRNPDVVVPQALASAGCERVPRLVGWVEGEWLLPDGTPGWGHLSAFAEFIAGSQDGWKIACAAVENGESFAGLASSLGATTASVHAALATALPTRPTTPEALEVLARHLRSRLAWAVAAAPALLDHQAAASAVIDELASLATAPDLQIVHGDLHLGQALHSEERGWVLLDFEGEPLRPLAERGDPDLALRDVAGMLRSFDYAAGHSVLGLPDDDARAEAASAWALQCRDAYLDGYALEAGADPRGQAVLLRALELDKALYETVYEVRHRPTWVEVPLRAVARLLSTPTRESAQH